MHSLKLLFLPKGLNLLKIKKKPQTCYLLNYCLKEGQRRPGTRWLFKEKIWKFYLQHEFIKLHELHDEYDYFLLKISLKNTCRILLSITF